MNQLRYKIFILVFTLLTSIFFSQVVHKSYASARAAIPILMYHYIRDYNNPNDKSGIMLSVSTSNFDQQMNYLSTHGYTPITLDTLAAIYANQAAAPAKPVVITFDDGYIDFYTNAFPILRKYNFHSVAFIPTGLIGSGGQMNWDQIKELQRSGLVSFEAHTIFHAYLPHISYQQMIKELQESKNTLQSQTGIVANFVAYPYGASNGTVIKAAQTLGYIGGIGTWFGKANGITMNMPRVRVNGGFPLSLFASRL